MATLIVQNGKHQGREFVLPPTTVTIGREDDCDIRLSSGRVSRKHCTLQPTSRGLLLTDLGSRNGTTVNGEAVVGSRVLRANDILKVGPWEFRIAGTHSGVAVTADRTSEDDIVAWLGTDEESTSDQSVGSDTTMIPRADTKRKFQSVAEEAVDIIRRHHEGEGSGG